MCAWIRILVIITPMCCLSDASQASSFRLYLFACVASVVCSVSDPLAFVLMILLGLYLMCCVVAHSNITVMRGAVLDCNAVAVW